MTKVKVYTKNREEALECLYTVAVRIAGLRLNPYANKWHIDRALEELEVFAHEVQCHGTSDSSSKTKSKTS